MRTHLLLPFLALGSLPCVALAAPPPPSGPHPRIWLNGPTLTAIKANAATPTSGAASAVAFCDDIVAHPSKYDNNDNWGWSAGAPSCGLAWRITGDPKHAAAGIKMFKALLDDQSKLGDGMGGDSVITHDSGYFIRLFAPYAALAYDWLWDAPGMDEPTRSHARDRFKAWLGWYAKNGYNHDTAGSNYHAGYVFGEALIAVAEGGEAGATGDAHWTNVVDVLYGQEILGKGLAEKGPLDGGDWAEGWQYGPLSVLEYTLGGRALTEQGASMPGLGTFASDLVVRYRHAMTPASDGQWVGLGDWDDPVPYAPLNPRALLAVLAGPSSDEAAGYAAFLRQSVATDADTLPFFDALAEARGAAPVDYTSKSPPLWTVIRGTRNVFARSSWDASAFWAVFTSAPHLVPDHQHADASNLAFSRGADHLIVDPSPYGSLSSLTGNAMTVESKAVGSEHTPSQNGAYGQADLTYARSAASGIVAARGDISQAFRAESTPSDVPFALRDWAFLPEGEIVTIDRTRTDDPSRATLLRFRSPSDFTLDATGAKGKVGGSIVDVRAVTLSPKPTVRHLTGSNQGCQSGGTFGVCDDARMDVGEYAVKLPGPAALAIHVIAGYAAAESPPDVASVNDKAFDPAGNPSIIGASVHRGTTHTYVVASSAKDGAAGGSLSYVVPADGATHHVVFDAPEDAMGASTVTAQAAGGRCTITITPGGAMAGRPLIFGIGDATDPCKPIPDAPNLPGGTPTGTGGGPGAGTGGATGAGATTGAGAAAGGAAAGGAAAAAPDAGDSGGGCGCRVVAPTPTGAAGLVGIAVAALFARRRRCSAR